MIASTDTTQVQAVLKMLRGTISVRTETGFGLDNSQTLIAFVNARRYGSLASDDSHRGQTSRTSGRCPISLGLLSHWFTSSTLEME